MQLKPKKNAKYVARSRGLAAPVVVVETGLKCQWEPDRPPVVGDRFRSIAWAEHCTGISRTQIVMQLSGRIRHARGVVFAYDRGAAR